MKNLKKMTKAELIDAISGFRSDIKGMNQDAEEAKDRFRGENSRKIRAQIDKEVAEKSLKEAERLTLLHQATLDKIVQSISAVTAIKYPSNSLEINNNMYADRAADLKVHEPEELLFLRYLHKLAT